MTHNFTQLNEMLTHECGGAMHRRVFILAGNETWQQNALRKILLAHVNDSLWVGKHAFDGFPFIATKKAHSWLGNEKKVVVFDANQSFDPDSFAAISGIVVGGGYFFLLLPAVDNWNTVYASPFGQRLLASIQTTPDLVVIKETDEVINLIQAELKSVTIQNCVAPFLTIDQQAAVEQLTSNILSQNNHPLVLISDRGRGKSAALGISAARLIKAGVKNIAITAPSLHATDIVFKHITENLPDATLSRGGVTHGESVIQFYSPDELMKGETNATVILVDEAAAIPVPLLSGYLDKYPQCVFATTVHGYEGTGRGFALRFNKILTEKYPGWLNFHMTTPIRWAPNDPLENWMFRLLCLDAEIINIQSGAEIELGKLEHRVLLKAQLVANQVLLNEIFALLVLAHYRTRPGDLQSLLDDEAINVYVTLYKEHVIAVALVKGEGRFSDSLSSAVYRGERRPSGHLLAQALTYHCGVEHAATLDYARVMRIAVHPELQQQGIGSALLDFITETEKQHGRDAIGTSFGMTTALLNFWRKAQFDLVRIGFTREQTSGEHAAIMLLPLTERGNYLHNEVCLRFSTQLPFWLEDILQDIPPEIANSFNANRTEAVELTQYEKLDLISFVHYSRNYELCIAAINKLVKIHHGIISQENFPDNFRRVLLTKIDNKLNWKETGRNMGLSGKNQARDVFHKAICYLHNTVA